ncbi:hypothetical protein K438DRAFT_1772460 [Mycena galopus ATCC 62051]|nr:hypothetical protein K438DRAFT_1772460 [Mycena galopus ATCC 62051]
MRLNHHPCDSTTLTHTNLVYIPSFATAPAQATLHPKSGFARSRLLQTLLRNGDFKQANISSRPIKDFISFKNSAVLWSPGSGEDSRLKTWASYMGQDRQHLKASSFKKSSFDSVLGTKLMHLFNISGFVPGIESKQTQQTQMPTCASGLEVAPFFRTRIEVLNGELWILVSSMRWLASFAAQILLLYHGHDKRLRAYWSEDAKRGTASAVQETDSDDDYSDSDGLFAHENLSDSRTKRHDSDASADKDTSAISDVDIHATPRVGPLEVENSDMELTQNWKKRARTEATLQEEGDSHGCVLNQARLLSPDPRPHEAPSLVLDAQTWLASSSRIILDDFPIRRNFLPSTSESFPLDKLDDSAAPLQGVDAAEVEAVIILSQLGAHP